MAAVQTAQAVVPMALQLCMGNIPTPWCCKMQYAGNAPVCRNVMQSHDDTHTNCCRPSTAQLAACRAVCSKQQALLAAAPCSEGRMQSLTEALQNAECADRL